MSANSAALFATFSAYIVGSVPFGFLIARYVYGVDVRQHGSGNIGATNVARVLGARAGSFALLLDVLKGVLPVLVLPRLLVGSESANALHIAVLCALGAIIGHMFPIWLGFKGGKGVATALGAVVVLSPIPALIAAVAFAVTFAAARIVSLSSMLAAVAFGAAQIWLLRPAPFAAQSWSLATFALAAPALIIFRHRSNIGRLLRGEEPRFKAKRKSVENSEDRVDTAI
jgi:glycerol-3-phosphate acyltransferase PlsY